MNAFKFTVLSADKLNGRIKKEVKSLNTDVDVKKFNVKVDFHGDNIKHLRGQLSGPMDTPYEGGIFEVDILIPDRYPFVAPKTSFLTKIWHPNVSSVTGLICLDILNDKWQPIMSIRTLLISLQALLSCPEPDDPQDAVVAYQYRHHKERYVQTARHWTNVYAQGSTKEPGMEEEIQKLVESGMGEQEARIQVSCKEFNPEAFS